MRVREMGRYFVPCFFRVLWAKNNKHKQLLGIVPGMGGGQISLCVAFFLVVGEHY